MSGDSRIQTHSVHKSLNPEWNIVEELPVSSIHNLVLDIICWDKDRFGKDYLGEFDLALEEIFANEHPEQLPKWYPLRSKRTGKKSSVVSGEVQLQFTLFDPANHAATHEQVMAKFQKIIAAIPIAASRTDTPSMTPKLTPTRSGPRSAPGLSPDNYMEDDEDDELEDLDSEVPEDSEELSRLDTTERRKRRLRIKGLKSRRRKNPYAFTNGGSDVVGIIFLEVARIRDLPPESNLTRTGFDMDPFVVVSLGKKTYRTRRVRHNLNPVFNEKLIFNVLRHEQAYSFAFTIIDHDKYSGNDFIASCSLPIQDLIDRAPDANLETGLYELRDPPDQSATAAPRPRFKRLGMSRSSSSQSVNKMIRPPLTKVTSYPSMVSQSPPSDTCQPHPANRAPQQPADAAANATIDTADVVIEPEENDFAEYVIPLKMKHTEKWEAKHNPVIHLRARYMPYSALRQQFWRALLKQYDTDESGRISRVELTTMLDTLGSTLRDSTIDSFFQRFPHKAADNEDTWDLTVDEAVICLEDQLAGKTRSPPSTTDKLKGLVGDMKNFTLGSAKLRESSGTSSSGNSGFSTPQVDFDPQGSVPISLELSTPGEEGYFQFQDDLTDDRGEEHVVEISECPICHQPRLNKRTDTDIITHIATCASQDWRQVNTVLMGGFVTASQAQRKWYSKVITKISYGGYKLGANSANILVQDRMTGQINEEKMSVYVRLGIRLLYKGLKSRDMEGKRSEWLPSSTLCRDT